jgi:regulator of RNase E activity RraA
VVGDLDGVIFFDFDLLDSVVYEAEHVAQVEEKLLEALNRKASMQDILRIGKAKTISRNNQLDE